MSNTLDTCPCCKSEATMVYSYNPATYRASCKKCECTTSEWFREEDAVYSWNHLPRSEISDTKQQAQAKLLDMCDGVLGQGHWEIVYNIHVGYYVEECLFSTSSPYRFKTKQSCQDALTAMTGVELGLIFNIKE